ncbi:hypothetical protein J8273_6427 [Carpediemonas membranifera]|uniref:Uncharacterized protein n=1 Tax=Carpediemonas membranifera TaxID=201153 RepID=A0A8J6B7J9_9EUKA|nr:hypothetical protein J8273_6427 [Carpediemonas membranifera]|eukprot:KAG9391662.1 hypothetical protein J8273_6427 [Carpediemonas membranifera]
MDGLLEDDAFASILAEQDRIYQENMAKMEDYLEQIQSGASANEDAREKMGLSLFNAQKRMAALEQLNSKFQAELEAVSSDKKKSAVIIDGFKGHIVELEGALKEHNKYQADLQRRLQERENTISALKQAIVSYSDVIKVNKMLTARHKEESHEQTHKLALSEERETALRRRLELLEETATRQAKQTEAAENAKVVANATISKLSDDVDRLIRERDAIVDQWEQMTKAMENRDVLMAKLDEAGRQTEGELKAAVVQLAGAGAREDRLKGDLVDEEKKAHDAARAAAAAQTALAKKTKEHEVVADEVLLLRRHLEEAEAEANKQRETIEYMESQVARSNDSAAAAKQMAESATQRASELEQEVHKLRALQDRLNAADNAANKAREEYERRQAAEINNQRGKADFQLQALKCDLETAAAEQHTSDRKLAGLEQTRDKLFDDLHGMQLKLERAEHSKNRAEALAASRGPDGGVAALQTAVHERDLQIERLVDSVRRLEFTVLESSDEALKLSQRLKAMEIDRDNLRLIVQRKEAVEGRSDQRAKVATTQGSAALVRLNDARLDLKKATDRITQLEVMNEKLRARLKLEEGKIMQMKSDSSEIQSSHLIDMDMNRRDAQDRSEDIRQAREENIRLVHRVTLLQERLEAAKQQTAAARADRDKTMRGLSAEKAKGRALKDANLALEKQLKATQTAFTQLKARAEAHTSRATSAGLVIRPTQTAEEVAAGERTQHLLEDAIQSGLEAMARAIRAEDCVTVHMALLSQIDSQLRNVVPARTIRYHISDPEIHPESISLSEDVKRSVEIIKERRQHMLETRVNVNLSQYGARWKGGLAPVATMKGKM